MRVMTAAVLAIFLTCSFGFAEKLPQSQLSKQGQAQIYPKIVLFSTSWCPHCKKAKEYFTKNNIPFINRDVELDSEAMELVTGKYKSQGVPIIIIGNDAEIIKGFDEQRFQKALEKYRKR